MLVRVGLFSLFLVILYFAIQKTTYLEAEEPAQMDVENLQEAGLDDIFYLPSSSTNVVIRHQHYALSYVEEYELPEWVAYELTAERLKTEWVDRSNDFRVDSLVKTGSAAPEDYIRSNYDRGHLAPAADMAFSEEAMSESFYMSNVAPQRPGFDQGVWRELEELTRDWAKHFKHLYVVTGPVLSKPPLGWIGKNKVAAPSAFYKVLLDLREPELKAIAFVIPNEETTQRIETFATSIDEVEKLTGIDFFPRLMEPGLEAELESKFDMRLWKTNEKKYQKRLKEWNLQK